MQPKIFQFAGARIAYDTVGTGDCIVLLHSLATNRQIFLEISKRLSETFNVLTYDLPGHGQSGLLSDGDYSFERIADLTALLLDHLGIARAHVLGISVGGEVAQVLAARHPSRVMRVVLADTACLTSTARAKVWDNRIKEIATGGMKQASTAMAERWFSPKFAEAFPATVSICRDWVAATSQEGYLGLVRTITTMDLRTGNASILAPTIVIYGTEDHNTGKDAAELIAASIPGASVLPIAGAGHFPHLETPDLFLSTVLGFLRPQRLGRATTPNASRYLQQLSKHWSHRFKTVNDAQYGIVDFGDGTSVDFDLGEGELLVGLHGPLERLDSLQVTVEQHVNRFAHKEGELNFRWAHA